MADVDSVHAVYERYRICREGRLAKMKFGGLKMENKSMYEVVMNDFKQVYNFEEKGGEVVGPKIKFPKAVYDRVQAFNTTEAFYNGWTYYGIVQLILGKLKKEECWFHPAIHEAGVSLKPSKEFKQWFDEHHTLGPVLIMLALVYGDYELEG